MGRISNILKKYLKSYIGIVMLCCITISVVFSFIISRASISSYYDSLETKNAALKADFTQQIKTLQDLRVTISSAQAFNARLLSRGKYYEIEMLEELVKYRNISPIADLVFIIYENDPERVFYTGNAKADAFSSDMSFFMANTLNVENPDEVKQRILETDAMKTISLGQNGLLVVLTASPVSSNIASTNIKLCFRVKSSLLVDRMITVTGFNGDSYRLVFMGECIKNTLSSADSSAEALQYEFYYPRTEDTLYRIFAHFKNAVLIASILETMIFIAVACAAAYSSYAPIRAAAYKFAYSNYVGKNELHELELQLQDAYDSLRESRISDLQNSRRLRDSKLLLAFLGIETGDMFLFMPNGFTNVAYRVVCAEVDYSVAAPVMEQLDNYSEADFAIYTCLRKGKYGMGILICFQNGNECPEAMQMVQEIFDALETDYALGKSSIGSDICKLYKEAIDDLDSKKVKPEITETQDYTPDVYEILEYAQVHAFDWEFSLSSLADRFECSASTMSARFKSAVDVSFKDWLIEKRVAEAKRLLDETSLSISQICAEVEYGNISHFIKIFKRTVGKTPGEWRETEK